MLPLYPQSGVYTRVSVRPRLSAFGRSVACVFFATALLFGNGSAQKRVGQINLLIQQLQSPSSDVRGTAARDLKLLGADAKDALPALIKALIDEDKGVRRDAAAALGQIASDAKDALTALIIALKDQDGNVRGAVAEVLGQMGPKAKEAVPALIAALNDPQVWVRRNAAQALGRIGADAKDILPALMGALNDETGRVREQATFAISSIAKSSFDGRRTETLPQLRKAYEEMIRHSDPDVRGEAETVKRMIAALEAISPSPLDIIRSWISNHPYWVVVAIYVLLFLALLLLLGLRPLWLLRLSEFFRWNVKLKPLGVEFDFPSRHLLLISLFHYHPRVLNAWVNHHLGTAKENFANKQTVAQRKVYVPMPATINEQMRDGAPAALFQPIFDKRKVTLLIVGEGGAGKTSLACQMATWAMADEPEQRLCKTHRMLPVLVEANLEPRTDNKDALVEAIRGGLREMIGEPEPIFEELLLHLLRKRRVLVIVDSLSELDETTRKSIRPASADFQVAALLITSRIDEVLGGASKSLLRPLRLKSDRLSTFMDRYLEQLGKRNLFNDDEYFEACRKLSQLVSDREITVLIAKLYAEQMIASKEVDAFERELPRNLPDLMLGYVKRLNDQVKADRQDIHKVIDVAKIVAWECLKQTCRPATAKRDDVLKALSKEPDAEALLKYIEDRLQLIQTAGPVSELVRFSLDPLAEYLAAQYLVERCGKFEDVWQEFFENAEKQPGAPETTKGFLLAARDCCAENGSKYSVPEWVGDSLTRLTGLDPETAKAARLKQRVNRLIADLQLPDADDRETAAKKLGEIGLEAKGSVPALIAALQDQVPEVRRAVTQALRDMGPLAVPALIIALKSTDGYVRRSATVELENMGTIALPALTNAITDQDPLLRRSAAFLLLQLGREAKEARQGLILALKDSDVLVRRSAAATLGKLGPEAKAAVPTLINTLNDEDAGVRTSVAIALGMIGSVAREALPRLLNALNDRDLEVRGAVASAIGKIGVGVSESDLSS